MSYITTPTIIYIDRPSLYKPKLGNNLVLTSELGCKAVNCTNINCENDHTITEFVSGCPKNYAYITDTGIDTCKVKSFSLSYKNSQIINFQSV